MWTKIAEAILEWARAGRTGRIAGTAAGIFLGIIYLIAGFWDTLAFALIVLIGYVLGLKSDNGEKWLDIDAVLRWFSDRWRR